MKFVFNTQSCKVCGQCSRRADLISYTTFGSRGLDFHNFPNIHYHSATCCPKCGYCNDNIESVTKEIKAYVQSVDYQLLRNDNRFPIAANGFICYAKVQELEQRPFEASEAWRYAAWECDDYGFDKQARVCREHSIEQLLKTSDSDDEVDQAYKEALLTDMYRRIGSFDQAQQSIARAKQLSLNPEQHAVFDFQMLLIYDKSALAYSTEIVFDELKYKEYLSHRGHGAVVMTGRWDSNKSPDNNRLLADPANIWQTVVYKMRMSLRLLKKR